MSHAPDRPVQDTVERSWVARAPEALRPFLRLARYDRPAGFWLLAIPCWAGLTLANLNGAWSQAEFAYIFLLGLGAVAMRGAGCTYNDIVDRELDAQVARTAQRPLPAGTVSLRNAWLFLFAQCGVGLGVLLSLPRPAQLVALLAIPLVAAYPFMKRITWFPQAWLGLTFNWGALVGYAAAAHALHFNAYFLFAGLAVWTFGYDTIYALQDVEDDALIGVKSTARFFGRASRIAIAVSYALCIGLVGYACFLSVIFAYAISGPIVGRAAVFAALIAIAAFAALLSVQVIRLKPSESASSLFWFKFNREAGLAFVLTLGLAPVLVQMAIA